MDILAHGLWGSALARAIALKKKHKVSSYKAAWWGIFPDLFAFVVPFMLMLWPVLSGQSSFSDLPRPSHNEEPTIHGPFILALELYNWSHSLFVFALVILAVWLFKRSWPLVMLAWPLHIFMDIPTHSARFFPTPFLWPFSDWKFDGIMWGVPWFMALNYFLLLVAYITLFFMEKRQKNG